MKKTITAIAAVAVLCLGFLAGHVATIHTLSIETDGDGDSAIVTTLGGNQHMYGINGYELR
ncbi:MAG: hypothetical protein KH138_03575 [Firmicutes bacterium]|nr:hypothetical protein [Bacillota bacterium]